MKTQAVFLVVDASGELSAYHDFRDADRFDSIGAEYPLSEGRTESVVAFCPSESDARELAVKLDSELAE